MQTLCLDQCWHPLDQPTADGPKIGISDRLLVCVILVNIYSVHATLGQVV
jgi:hypothetical protein